MSGEALTDMLIRITKEIEDRHFGGPDGYGLGGEYGYGANYDSDVFQMSRFCWCDGDDCPWCSYSPEEGRRFTEAAKSKGAISDEYGSGGAPHFWHKPSGMRVWWYKWIGHDMETYALPDDLAPILADCLADIATHPTPDSRTTDGEASYG